MRLSLPCSTAAAATAAVLAAAAPAQAKDAVYGGATRTGAALVVKADSQAKQLRSIVISWAAPCTDGSNFTSSSELTPVAPIPGFAPSPDELLVTRNRNGRFAGTRTSSADYGDTTASVEVTLSGTLKPGRASGSLAAIVKVVDKATGNTVTTCDRSTSWIATRIPGTIYGGATSQGEPVVLRVNAKRRRVDDVLTTWNAPCGSGGYLRYEDHWGNFGVSTAGSFGDSFSDDSTSPAGDKYHVDFDVKGKFTRIGAKGSLQVKVTMTDPAGTVNACDTRNVAWKATTG